MKESDILHENGCYWVMLDSYKSKPSYTVMKNGITHSESVDGVTYQDLSVAIARCNYLANKHLTK